MPSKTEITKNNFVFPSLTSLCAQQSQIDTPSVHVKSPIRLQKPHHLPKTHINIITKQKLQHFINVAIAKDKTHPTTYKQQHVNVILQKNQLKSELIEWFHLCAGAPVKTTWMKAIKNNHYHTWPGLTTQLVHRHLAPSVITSKGYIHHEKGNLHFIV